MGESRENFGVSVITCTNKIDFMNNIFNNYQNQTLKNKELVIILNNNKKLSLKEWKDKSRSFPNVSVFQINKKVSLGKCLNYGIKKAKYNYIAKFDDDDFYAPAYLSESLHAIESTNADVVGKRTHFMYMPNSKKLFIRFPSMENKFVRRIQGGTILAKRSVFDKVKFRDISLGEDNRFYEDCRAKGFKIYSTNRFLYTYTRRKDNKNHTWKTKKKYLIRKCLKVVKTTDYRPYVDRPTSDSKEVKFSEKDAVFDIPRKLIWETFKQCKKKKAFGIDAQSIKDFGSSKRLGELWKQLSSGNYFPSPVRRAYRRKPNGGYRALGVPTVSDHLVQTMLRDHMASVFNARWHPNSFAHLRGKAAKKAALETARERCLHYDWALILDVKKYGDNIDHKILMNMLRKYFDNQWVLLYTSRMLKVPVRLEYGTLQYKDGKGVSHDNSLSPFLVDFYMHEIFDEWMKQNHPNIAFERFVDDIIIHCSSETEAKSLLSEISSQFNSYNLERNNKKTKIVYCKDKKRKGRYNTTSFTFLENTFRARNKKRKSGKRITVFGPRKKLIFK